MFNFSTIVNAVVAFVGYGSYKSRLEDFFLERPQEWVSFSRLHNKEGFNNPLKLSDALAELNQEGFLLKRTNTELLKGIMSGEVIASENFDPTEPENFPPTICEFMTMRQGKPTGHRDTKWTKDGLLAPT